MSRPARMPTDAVTSGWVAHINDNFEAVLDKPVPLAVSVTGVEPKLNRDCLYLQDAKFRISDGSAWVKYRVPVPFIASLDTGTATINDIKTAYNTLLTSMVANRWMEA